MVPSGSVSVGLLIPLCRQDPLFRWCVPLDSVVPPGSVVPLGSVGPVTLLAPSFRLLRWVPLGFAVLLVPLLRWFTLFHWVPLFRWFPLFCWVPLFRWVPLFPCSVGFRWFCWVPLVSVLPLGSVGFRCSVRFRCSVGSRGFRSVGFRCVRLCTRLCKSTQLLNQRGRRQWR